MTGTKSAWNFWNFLTHGLDINQIPKAMPELLQGTAVKWFIAKNRFLETGFHPEISRNFSEPMASW